MKNLSLGTKALLAGLAVAGLMVMMILKGFEVATFFESIAAEIAFVSILFVGSLLLICYGLGQLLDDYVFKDKKRPTTF